ncbi:MAG: CHAD domain-containing protein [SAR324 cluster bacterium]|nr:CHAD domain-containing protein [SAR324 cluster bacterium]
MESLLIEISKHYTHQTISAEHSLSLLLDSFDWRLYNKGYLLRHSNQHSELLNMDGHLLHKATIPQKKRPRFIHDFPKGKLKDSLTSILAPRALLERAQIVVESCVYTVLDQEKKTVVRLQHEQIFLQSKKPLPPLQDQLICTPLRGYEKEFTTITRILTEDCGLTAATKSENIMKLSLEKMNRRVKDYSSKADLNLDENFSGLDAAKYILGSTFETITRNEQGIIDDLDIEFLHDFRVAVRRSRSLLSLLKGIFHDTITDELKTDLKKMGSLTGALRDHDVYLDKKDEYKKMVPAALRPGLDKYFEDIHKQRIDEQKKLTQFLQSKEYQQISRKWQQYMRAPQLADMDKGNNADISIKKLASKSISKRYKKIIATGQMFDHQTEDSEIHQMRIEFKKLRYLLEFFKSLFSKNEMNHFIQQLKTVQNCLGNFNDLSVQQESLMQHIQAMPCNRKEHLMVAASLGGLIAHMSEEQQKLRTVFFEDFEIFANQENQNLFDTLIQF